MGVLDVDVAPITEAEIDQALREGRYDEFMLDEYEHHPARWTGGARVAGGSDLFDAPRASRSSARRHSSAELRDALGVPTTHDRG